MDTTPITYIDAPVSGGKTGAINASITVMWSGSKTVLEELEPYLHSFAKSIIFIGKKPGQGQVMKACLQSLIGSIFSATFEAAALAAKAGLKGETLYNVFSTSGAGCGVSNTALENIIDRKFVGTGSHISTMHKDLTISLNLAKELGVPMHMSSTAMQLFQAGKTRYPKGDNWAVTKIIEEIIGAELHR